MNNIGNNMENPNLSSETSEISEAPESEEEEIEGMIEVPEEGSKFFEESDKRIERTIERFKEEKGIEEGEKEIKEVREEVKLDDGEKEVKKFITRGEIDKAESKVKELGNKLYELMEEDGPKAKAARLLLQAELFKIYRKFTPKRAIKLEMEALSTSLSLEEIWEDNKVEIMDDSETTLKLLEALDKMKKDSGEEGPYLEKFKIGIIERQVERILSEESKEEI